MIRPILLIALGIALAGCGRTAPAGAPAPVEASPGRLQLIEFFAGG